MTVVQFVTEWMIRSSALIMAGAALLWLLRVKDSSIRLAAWTAILAGSLLLPAMTAALPALPLRVIHPATDRAPVLLASPETASQEATAPVSGIQREAPPSRFNWPFAAFVLYVAIAAGMLLRVGIGLTLSLRLLRRSRGAGEAAEGIAIFESDEVASPVTLGILRPAIVLPAGWNAWREGKREAVLAHECSHIRRFDPLVQLLSAVHRALLWISPFVWFLHSRIVRTAEEASDDDAIVATGDRGAYAEFLLDFMTKPPLRFGAEGVPMARYGPASSRIQRILDAAELSRGLTLTGLIAILALGCPLAYVFATAQPKSAIRTPAAAVPAKRTSGGAPPPAPVHVPVAASRQTPAPLALTGLGSVAARTVTVRTQVDGRLTSVNFREGQVVQAGAVVAIVDPGEYRNQLERAQAKIAVDRQRLSIASQRYRAGTDSPDATITAQANLDTDAAQSLELENRIRDTQIRTPVTGIAGLRLVEPGNIVHPSDADGIVVVAQVQPIDVLFTLPENRVQLVRELFDSGKNARVEAWSADDARKIATGTLTGMNNQIDLTEGTIKLKATFDNKNRELFPNQFVNVRLLLAAH